jgi:hypothetical protein
MYENRMPRMLGHEREEVMVGCRKWHYEKHECADWNKMIGSLIYHCVIHGYVFS